MMFDKSYKQSLMLAIGFHLLVAFFLLAESSHQKPVLENASQTMASHSSPIPAMLAKQEPVKAVSIDNQEVQKTINRLKTERAHQAQVETQRQQAILNAAEAAKQQRIAEQQRIIKLKQEEEKIAILKQKHLEEEKAHLKQLELAKIKEEKHIEAMKKQQAVLEKKHQEEQKKLEELTKKRLEDEIKEKKALALKEKNENDKKVREMALKKAAALKEAATKAETAKLAKMANEKAQQDARAQAAEAQRMANLDAANQARMAGEVNKYKALIVNAIGRQWILPESVNPGLSSQFRIRLAPDGAVLDVNLTKSSGDATLDRSAQTAIYKASPLPVPTDAATFDLFRDISLTVRPENVRG